MLPATEAVANRTRRGQLLECDLPFTLARLSFLAVDDVKYFLTRGDTVLSLSTEYYHHLVTRRFDWNTKLWQNKSSHNSVLYFTFSGARKLSLLTTSTLALVCWVIACIVWPDRPIIAPTYWWGTSSLQWKQLYYSDRIYISVDNQQIKINKQQSVSKISKQQSENSNQEAKSANSNQQSVSIKQQSAIKTCIQQSSISNQQSVINKQRSASKISKQQAKSANNNQQTKPANSDQQIVISKQQSTTRNQQISTNNCQTVISKQQLPYRRGNSCLCWLLCDGFDFLAKKSTWNINKHLTADQSALGTWAKKSEKGVTKVTGHVLS